MNPSPHARDSSMVLDFGSVFFGASERCRRKMMGSSLSSTGHIGGQSARFRLT